MRLEQIPLILGVLVALVGLGLVVDAYMPDTTLVPRERRRRMRADRDRRGEAAVGVGTLCMGAALVGGDSWRFGTLAVLVGTVLILAGAVLNRRYLREALTFRGPARRLETSADSRPATEEPASQRPVSKPSDGVRTR